VKTAFVINVGGDSDVLLFFSRWDEVGGDRFDIKAFELQKDDAIRSANDFPGTSFR
jgi:hypothetical protein